MEYGHVANLAVDSMVNVYLCQVIRRRLRHLLLVSERVFLWALSSTVISFYFDHLDYFQNRYYSTPLQVFVLERVWDEA